MPWKVMTEALLITYLVTLRVNPQIRQDKRRHCAEY